MNKETLLTQENKKLKQFYQAVARLTSDHHIENDKACIYASELGALLEKVDPKWYCSVAGNCTRHRRDYEKIQRSKKRIFKKHGTAGF